MKKIATLTIFVILILSMVITGWSRLAKRPIQSNIQKGQYIPKIPVKITDLRSMPIPSTNEDYAFLQSIDRETNIVIGRFGTGTREIILIKDKNSDGIVDLVVRYFVDRKRYRYSSKPSVEY